MGVCIEVVSETNPSFYSENDPNRYLNYAWSIIRWEEIFDVLGIDMSPYIYYDDPDYNYRSPAEVEAMRNAIHAFVEKDITYCDEETNRLRDKLHDDAVKLLEFFDYYVANGAYIVLF